MTEGDRMVCNQLEAALFGNLRLNGRDSHHDWSIIHYSGRDHTTTGVTGPAAQLIMGKRSG
jgi:hypothetical protein